MTLQDVQNRQFNDRLRRISGGGANTMRQIHVGPVDEAAVRNPRSEPGPLVQKITAILRAPLVVAAAFGSGLIAGAAVLYGRFLYSGAGLIGADADLTMLTNIGIALVVCVLMRLLLRVRSNLVTTLQTFGVIAAVTGMHNLVQLYPQAFTLITSAEWTAEVLEQTQPNSILFRGESYPLTG